MNAYPATMTLAEMATRWPGEWVLIDQPIVGEHPDALRGRVLFHSPDRGEIEAKVEELPPPRRFAVRFVGPFPGGTEFLL